MKYFLPQQKVLRKILEKVFITEKFTQCKTSLTLKINVFEMPNNKNVGKLFSKCELLFLHKANSSGDPSQILILQFPILRASRTPLPSMSNVTLSNWNPSTTQSSSCSLSVSLFPYFILPHSTTLHHMYWIYQTICQAQPNKFVIELYTDRNS